MDTQDVATLVEPLVDFYEVNEPRLRVDALDEEALVAEGFPLQLDVYARAIVVCRVNVNLARGVMAFTRFLRASSKREVAVPDVEERWLELPGAHRDCRRELVGFPRWRRNKLSCVAWHRRYFAFGYSLAQPRSSGRHSKCIVS